MHEGADVLAVVQKRHSELFGSVATQKASLRLMKDENKVAVLRASLEEAESVLAAIALCDPPMVTVDMSSSMKRLRRRL